MCSMSVVRVSFISQLLGTSIFFWFHHFLFENDLWDDWDDRSARNEPPEVSWERFGDQAPELLKMSLQRPPESDLATRPQNCWKWVSRGGKISFLIFWPYIIISYHIVPCLIIWYLIVWYCMISHDTISSSDIILYTCADLFVFGLTTLDPTSKCEMKEALNDLLTFRLLESQPQSVKWR